MTPLRFLAGPELYWVVIYFITAWFTRRNLPPTEAGSRFLEKLGWLIPIIAVPASFLFYALPFPPRWLTVRLLFAAVIGVNVVSFKLISGINYGDSRNSGVLGVWVYSILGGMVGYVGGLILWWVL